MQRKKATIIKGYADGGMVRSRFNSRIDSAVNAATPITAAKPVAATLGAGLPRRELTGNERADMELRKMRALQRARDEFAASQTTPEYKHGGRVKGKGTGRSDSIHAKLSNGEYVMPADSVKKIGAKKLDKMRAATHRGMKRKEC